VIGLSYQLQRPASPKIEVSLASCLRTNLVELTPSLELMYTELCTPMQGNSCIPQDICWPDLFSDSRGVSLRNLDSSNSSGLTTINDNVMEHQSSCTFPADIPDSYLTSTRTGEHDNNDRSSLAPKSFVRKLASLSIALHECSEKLPTMAIIATECEIPPGHSNDTMHGSRKITFFVIDELFRLTSEFIDVMKCFSVSECEIGTTPSSTDPGQAGSESTMSLISYDEQTSHSSMQMTRNTISPPSRSFSHMEEATMFMVVSCHCRITELYSSVFELMQACIEHKLPPRIDKHWAVILPNLQFGSVTTPPVQVDIDSPLSPSNSSMYMLMFTMLSSQLWEQLVEVMRAGCAGEVSTSPGSLSRSTLVDMMWDRVTEKNKDLSQIIDSTRHLLQRYSVTAEL
jgi:hypothetical protein